MEPVTGRSTTNEVEPAALGIDDLPRALKATGRADDDRHRCREGEALRIGLEPAPVRWMGGARREIVRRWLAVGVRDGVAELLSGRPRSGTTTAARGPRAFATGHDPRCAPLARPA